MLNDVKRMMWRGAGAVVVVSVLAVVPVTAQVVVYGTTAATKDETFRATKSAKREWPRRMEKEQTQRLEEQAAVRAAARAAAAAARPPVVRAPVVVPYLTQLRRRMVAGEHLTTAEIRDLADSGDSLAAYNFAERLVAMDKPDLLPDAAHYYTMAVALGRDYGRSHLVTLMMSRDVVIKPTRLENAKRALVGLSDQGDEKASLALAQMYTEGWPFEADPNEAQVWLAAAAANGSTEAVQKMTMAALLPREGANADPVAVRAALDLLAASGDPGKVAIAQNLLAQLDAADLAAEEDVTQ